MHSATQIIAQRAPPATRMKARWQPYAIQSSSASSSSTTRSPYLNTPHASVSSPLPSQISSCDVNRTRQPHPTPTTQTPKDVPPRDSTKHKFAAGLIDQAVNTLSEIWRPQDIPRVFQAPTKGANTQSTPQYDIHSHSKSIPPPSLSTQPPPTSVSGRSTQENISVPTPILLATGTDFDQNLLPMKTFVHEVLRRSRTSGSILQAALCYLEAIRSQVPELLRQENMGIRAHYQPDSRIQPATPEELEREAELCAMEESFNTQYFDDSMKTIRVTDCGPEELEISAESDDGSISSLIAEASVVSKASTPSLPSPLLCPRRTFLASLILASKFFQDKCYSNRAWAKLSGLPPREIGRCEKALGQALEWRLWVGKSSPMTQSSTPTAGPNRIVVRSQSEGSVLPSSSSNRPFLAQDESQPIAQDLSSGKQTTTPRFKTGLRRASTLPKDTFAAQLGMSCGAAPIKVDQDMDTVFEDQKQEQESSMAFTNSTSTASPETPGLTYSPSSTESSSSDRTIQMSSFEDNTFPPVDGSKMWLEQVDPRFGAIKSASPAPFDGTCHYDSNFLLDLARLHSRTSQITVVQSETVSCSSQYLWHEDRPYISLEAAGVH